MHFRAVQVRGVDSLWPGGTTVATWPRLPDGVRSGSKTLVSEAAPAFHARPQTTLFSPSYGRATKQFPKIQVVGKSPGVLSTASRRLHREAGKGFTKSLSENDPLAENNSTFAVRDVR